MGFGDPAVSAVPHIELGPRSLSGRRYVVAMPRWRRLARAFRPDVVHSHFVSSYGLMAGFAGVGAPVIQFAWGSDILQIDQLDRLRRGLIARALRRASAVVVDAPDVGERVALMASVTPQVAVVFGPERAWTEVPRRSTTSILSPRQLREFYNVRVIVEAFAMVAPDLPGWTLDVLTGGDDASELTALASELGIGARVVFHGRLTRQDLQKRFLASEIVCSVPSHDATSVALLEGMASGAFPIVSDLPANRVWVTDGSNGLVVPAGDVAELAAAMRTAMGDPSWRHEAASVNRTMIAERGSWELAVDAVDACSDQVVAERRRSRQVDSQRSAS